MDDSDKFEKDSFRNKTLPNSDGVQLIMGKLKGKDSMTAQAYRFPKDKYTPEEAKAWLKDNDVKDYSFEEAKEDKSKNAAYDPTQNDPPDDTIENIIIAWVPWESEEIRSPADDGVWKIESQDWKNPGQMRTTRYEFDPEKFTEEEAKDWLHKHDVDGVTPITIPMAKSLHCSGEGSGEGDLSYHYLMGKHLALEAHPSILDHVKKQIHLTARAYAGGKSKGKIKSSDEGDEGKVTQAKYAQTFEQAKQFQAANLLPNVVETSDYFDVDTVFAKEGVFVGTDGKPVKRTYENLKANVNRFFGVPQTETHLLTDSPRPSDRIFGHSISSKARDDHRDIFGITRYYKKDLNAKEIERIQKREFPDTSPGFFVSRKVEEGEFQGKKYQAVEEGPMIVTEIANFFEDKGFGLKGACPRTAGCGPYQHAANSHNPAQAGTGGNNMTPNPAEPDIKELSERLITLEKKLNAGGISAEEFKALRTDIDGIKDSLKTFNSTVQAVNTIQANESAALEAAHKAEFGKMLNAANGPDVPEIFEKNWAEAKLDVLGWRSRNPDKLMSAAPGKGSLNGKAMNAAMAAEDSAKANAHAALSAVGDKR